MAQERTITTHIKAAEEYLQAATKLIKANEHFAAVLCAAIGAERAAMALILHLSAVPATGHRHHEILKTLQPLIPEENRKQYQETVEAIAELMGHLTMVRYKYELAGEHKTPKQLYDAQTTQKLYNKAQKILNFTKLITGK
jgi:HEPN domain-containing protein